MPLPFEIVCELLEECHNLAVQRKSHATAVEAWFWRHRGRVDAHDSSVVALLSTLLPDKRSDRVYCIQAPRLEKVIGRGLSLGSSRIADLARYRHPGNASDLGDCVERVLTITPMHLHKDSRVMVEEIDETLHGYASNMRWSSPSVRSQTSVSRRNQRDLELLYQRCTPQEGKWFTRLVLKKYEPLCFDSFQIYRLCDPVLPSVLSIREDFDSAINALQSTRSSLLPNASRGGSRREQILGMIKPQLGIKVGRQHWMKARSIGHCLSLGHGRMSVEEKIDGEYCQVHVDFSKGGSGSVQIFSKSGKDSTEDKTALHSIIKDSLRVGKPGCLFSQGCIVEGEIVVYDDQSKRILPFHKIRNHVTRRGIYLNTDKDELPTAYEHVMFIYYDVLMLDKQSFLNVRHSERFKILTTLVERQSGWAEIVPRRTIDFDSRMAASDLRNLFAKTITSKQEGLVLKPDEPYFDFTRGDRPIGARCIKLKKEYIGNFGDIGDLAAVGAGYDPATAKSYRIPHLQWTHFYVGTLNNKEKVQRWRAKPEFTITNVVELNETLLKSVVQSANPRPVPRMENAITDLHLPVGVEKNPSMTVAFENPLVFDLRCFSFDKEGNTGFWTPRFPGVTKVHFDRDFTDCLSFDQLQELALESTTVPDLPDSQENLEWIARLEGADPRRIAVDAESEGSLSTMLTPSPRRHSTQSSEPHSQQSALSLPASTSPVSISQSNGLKPTVAFAVAASHLATPPTSSAPEEVAEEQTRTSGSPQTFKSTQPTVLSPTTSNKRRRASHAPTTARASHIKRRRSSPIRKPLSEIDGNNSQTSSSSVKMGTVTEPEIIDLTSSPEPSSEEPVIIALESPAGDSAPSQDSQPISVFPPDDANNDSGAVATTEQDQEPDCTFAGTKCGFFNTCVILSPCLVDPPREVGTLIETHGLNNATMSVDEWLESYGKLGGSLQHNGVPGRTIVLVDSLEHISETERILKTLDDHRSRESRKREEWITAYDWRVLRYVSIMEDESVTRKYYDGFTDPWLRWFCGLV